MNRIGYFFPGLYLLLRVNARGKRAASGFFTYSNGLGKDEASANPLRVVLYGYITHNTVYIGPASGHSRHYHSVFKGQVS